MALTRYDPPPAPSFGGRLRATSSPYKGCRGTSRRMPAFCCRRPGRPCRPSLDPFDALADFGPRAAPALLILAARAARPPAAAPNPSSAAILRLAAPAACPFRQPSSAGTGSRGTPPRTVRASQPDLTWSRSPWLPRPPMAFEARTAAQRRSGGGARPCAGGRAGGGEGGGGGACKHPTTACPMLIYATAVVVP